MSEHSTPEERTEMPTEKRMSQLRKDGQIHFSNEIVMVISLVSGFLILKQTASWIIADLKLVLVRAYTMMGESEPLSVATLHAGFLRLIGLLAPDIAIIVGTVAVCSSLAVMLQTRWNVKQKKIHFRFPEINPLNGIKRIFSVRGVVNTIKALLKLAIILPIGYIGLKRFIPEMILLVHMPVEEIFTFTAIALDALFWKILYVLIALAIFDYFWGKFQWLKNNKMTKDEVKDERKAIEGDEATKRKIQAKGMQRIVQRIRQSVPKADVVVTNPTHYAVALKYDRDTMRAPTVVAKGKGFLALRIREIAKQSGVPVLERKALARALYGSTEVGSQIPNELFKAVAEVLAYVYRIRNPQRYAQGSAKR